MQVTNPMRGIEDCLQGGCESRLREREREAEILRE